MGTFLVCEHLDDDILGIDLINNVGISYYATAQQVFAISDAKDTLVATRETAIRPFSTKITMAGYLSHLNPSATHVATIILPRLRYLLGGPVLVDFSRDRIS